MHHLIVSSITSLSLDNLLPMLKRLLGRLGLTVIWSGPELIQAQPPGVPFQSPEFINLELHLHPDRAQRLRVDWQVSWRPGQEQRAQGLLQRIQEEIGMTPRLALLTPGLV